MQKPIICKGKIYAKTYIMQGQNICKRPIICKGKIYAKDLYYARAKSMQKTKIKTYNMQGETMCKDL